MSKKKVLLHTEDMRDLIKNIYDVAHKLSGHIRISDLDAAANFAAYLHGFSSWREYKVALSKEITKIRVNQVDTLPLPKFEDIILEEILEWSSQLAVSPPKDSLEPVVSNLPPLEWLVGSHRHIQGKIDEPRGLLSENSLIIGSPLSDIATLYEKQVTWLNYHSQSFLIFAAEEKSKIFQQVVDKMEGRRVNIIGKNYLRINPLDNFLTTREAEIYFGINLEAKEHFPTLWIGLVRHIQETQKIQLGIKELLEFTDLPVLYQLSLKLSAHPLGKLLKNYLVTSCKVDNPLHINTMSLETHFVQSGSLINKLREIEILYNEGYFTTQPDYSLENAVFNKENTIIVREQNQCYMELLTLLYASIHTRHSSRLAYVNPLNYTYWTIWWEAEQWLSEKTSSVIAEIKEGSVMTFYINSTFDSLSPLLNQVNQIMFLQQNLTGYSQQWQNKMLCQTSECEVNFWFENNKVLRDLKPGEALLWKTVNNLFNPEGLEEYHLEKITLY